jgi:hypothetical protein
MMRLIPLFMALIAVIVASVANVEAHYALVHLRRAVAGETRCFAILRQLAEPQQRVAWPMMRQ